MNHIRNIKDLRSYEMVLNNPYGMVSDKLEALIGEAYGGLKQDRLKTLFYFGRDHGGNRGRDGEDYECLYKRKGIPKDSLLFFWSGKRDSKAEAPNRAEDINSTISDSYTNCPPVQSPLKST